jgi:hypothetical protein
MRWLFKTAAVLFLLHLFLNTDDLFFALLGHKELIHFEESLLKSFFVLALLKVLVVL